MPLVKVDNAIIWAYGVESIYLPAVSSDMIYGAVNMKATVTSEIKPI